MTPPGGTPSWTRSPRTNLLMVARELRHRQLRLHDLPPVARRLARVVLAVTVVAAFGLMLYPLIETGNGQLPWTNTDLEPTGLSLPGFLLVFGGSALALAVAAFAAPGRWRRVVAGGAALAGFVMMPTDVSGGLGGGFSWPLASWSMFLGLSAVLLLVSAAVFNLPRSRHTLAVLAAVPPLSAMATVLLLQPVRLPLNVVEDELVVQRLVLSESVQGAGALAGLFGILAIWAVIEYSKSLGAASGRTARLRTGLWWAVPALAALKVVWMAAASARLTPSPASPATTPLEALVAESPLSLALAVAFVGALLLAARARWLRRDHTEVTTGVFWLLVIPTIAAFVIPTVIVGAASAAYRFALRLHVPPPDELAAWQEGLLAALQRGTEAIDAWHGTLLDAAPLITSLAAIATATYAWRRHRSAATAAPFLAAYGIWTLVPAVSLLLMRLGAPIWDRPPGPDGVPSLLGNVSPMTLDAAVTVAVLVLSLLAVTRRVTALSPPLLLGLLVASSVIAYGDQFTPPAWATVLFWIGLGFPVFIQYGLDAAVLNRAGHDRSARVLFALAATLLALSASYAALLTGAVAPGDSGTAAMVRQLALMPLVLTFVLAYGGLALGDDPGAVEGQGVEARRRAGAATEERTFPAT